MISKKNKPLRKNTRPMKVTIVGGGFGGVKATLELAKDRHIQVTLISNSRHFQYYPALYAVATGYSHRSSWIQLQTIFQHKPNVTLVFDTITKIDPDKKRLTSAVGKKYSYHTLILAMGSVTTYFGIKGLDTYAYGIKSEQEIRRLQDHLFHEMRDDHIIEKHYVVIGAGPTGVELAASLGQYLERLRQHFGLQKQKLHIDLIEAAPRILPRSHPKISEMAARILEDNNVNIECNKRVESENSRSLIVNGRPIRSHTVIWTSGVANSPFFTHNSKHFSLDKQSRVLVNNHLRASNNIFVIGDNAATPYAGMAQTALHNASYVARFLKLKRRNKYTAPYKPFQPASAIPLGKNSGVFEWKKLRFSGWPAVALRSAADLIGYYELLPLREAIEAWRASDDYELKVPDNLT